MSNTRMNQLALQGNYAVSGGVKGVEAVEAKAKSFKARMTVSSCSPKEPVEMFWCIVPLASVESRHLYLTTVV